MTPTEKRIAMDLMLSSARVAFQNANKYKNFAAYWSKAGKVEAEKAIKSLNDTKPEDGQTH